MGIYAGLVGPKSGNVEKVLVFESFLKGSRRARVIQENEHHSEPSRWEGKREGKPSLMILEVWEVWRF